MVAQLTLDALQDFAYCPMRCWWGQIAGVPAPLTLDDVAHAVLREALWEYARIYWMGAKEVPPVVQETLKVTPGVHPLQVIVTALWGYRFIKWGAAGRGRPCLLY